MASLSTKLRAGILAALVAWAGPLAAEGEKAERQDRNVDRAALAAQEQAIARANNLVRRYKGTDRERALRIRLLEIIETAANLEFRIAHGEAHTRHRRLDLSRYEGKLKSLIENANFVIAAAPSAEDSSQIYFLRGQAYGELKQKDWARRDYETIVQRFPQSGVAVRASMALAGFATEAGAHRLAIQYLRRVEAVPGDPHYPLALYQLAWSHYNLGEIPTAISYIKQHITFLRLKMARVKGKIAESDRALWEHSLKDLVTFYFDGMQRKFGEYTVADALASFRSVESGPQLGKMIVHFAKLLRSRDMADDLGTWQQTVVREESARPEALEVIMVNFECLFVRKSFDKMLAVAQGFRELDQRTEHRLRKSDSYEPAQKLLLATAGSLQKSIAAEKNPEASFKLSRILAGVYEAFTSLVDEHDPRVAEIHYNLAETLFRVRDYDGSTAEYFWVLNHWQSKLKLKKNEVMLKTIASRYQSLDQRKLVPKDIRPAALAGDEKPNLADLEKPAAEWIGWVDDYLRFFGHNPRAFEQFEFEADRLLYGAGQTRAALARLTKLVRERPDSPSSVGAASLILDTYVSNKDWQLTLDASEQFLAVRNLGDGAFRRRLAGLPADASYKLIEATYQAKEYAKVLDQVDRFATKYASSPRVADTLYLASRAADQLKDSMRTKHFLSELLTRFPRNDKRSVALLSRAGIEDSGGDFDAAAKDYADYLAATPQKGEERESAAKRFFYVSWLSRQPRLPNCSLVSANEDLATECDRYRALIILGGTPVPDAGDVVRMGLRGPKANRPYWAAVALRNAKTVGLRDRIALSNVLAVGWKNLDPLVQFTVLPIVNRALPEAFALTRRGLSGAAPLRNNPKALARRVELMRDMENSAGKAVGLPWARVKIAVLAEMAQAYLDFCTELGKLPPPKDITPEEAAEYKKNVQEILDPFRQKGKSIRSQAQELAGEFPIAPEDIPGLTKRAPAATGQPVDLALLAQIDGGAAKLPPDSPRAQWEEAVRARAWARASFLLQQYKEKNQPPESTLAVMRAVSLSLAGAEPEALAELESARADLGPAQRRRVNEVLLAQYRASTAPGKGKGIAEELATPEPKAPAPAPAKGAAPEGEAKP